MFRIIERLFFAPRSGKNVNKWWVIFPLKSKKILQNLRSYASMTLGLSSVSHSGRFVQEKSYQRSFFLWRWYQKMMKVSGFLAGNFRSLITRQIFISFDRLKSFLLVWRIRCVMVAGKQKERDNSSRGFNLKSGNWSIQNPKLFFDLIKDWSKILQVQAT